MVCEVENYLCYYCSNGGRLTFTLRSSNNDLKGTVTPQYEHTNMLMPVLLASYRYIYAEIEVGC
jgi:hypothetical protein